MNVIVSVDALELVAAVHERCGLPRPHDEGQREVFGVYDMGVCSDFLVYEPETRSWSCLKEDTAIGLFASDWPIEEQQDLSALMQTLQPYRPDIYPADRNKRVRKPLFLYQGWQFAWIFVPELKRWELAPLGRA